MEPSEVTIAKIEAACEIANTRPSVKDSTEWRSLRESAIRYLKTTFEPEEDKNDR